MRHLIGSRELRRDIQEFLVGLGGDGWEVASRLRREGVVGIPKSYQDCAIARYLTSVLAGDPRVASLKVTKTGVVIRRTRWLEVTISSPSALREFVALFDGGMFPDLVQPNALVTHPVARQTMAGWSTGSSESTPADPS